MQRERRIECDWPSCSWHLSSSRSAHHVSPCRPSSGPPAPKDPTFLESCAPSRESLLSSRHDREDLDHMCRKGPANVATFATRVIYSSEQVESLSSIAPPSHISPTSPLPAQLQLHSTCSTVCSAPDFLPAYSLPDFLPAYSPPDFLPANAPPDFLPANAPPTFCTPQSTTILSPVSLLPAFVSTNSAPTLLPSPSARILVTSSAAMQDLTSLTWSNLSDGVHVVLAAQERAVPVLRMQAFVSTLNCQSICCPEFSIQHTDEQQVSAGTRTGTGTGIGIRIELEKELLDREFYVNSMYSCLLYCLNFTSSPIPLISQVFLRAGVLSYLLSERELFVEGTVGKIQSLCRGFLARKNLEKRKVCTRRLLVLWLQHLKISCAVTI